ncbi:MAG: glycosyltransferase family 4 protein [Deltaproteobacteria bacterium]|nr:glycosyltransferase family 4 protein [Deltaproteobacteria bacterium]
MRIGINALYLLPGKVGGSETYALNIVKGLLDADRENEYVIFINRECAGLFEKHAPGARIVRCPLNASSRPMRILWEQFVLPFQLRRHKIDLLFSPGLTTPFFSPVPSALVIFDMQHVNQPQFFPAFFLFFLRTIIRLSAKAASRIITISERSKKDVVEFYGIRPDKISVTYLAANKAFGAQNKTDADRVRGKYGLPERFILYAAASLPHKNHLRLLEAFKSVLEKFPDVRLVLTGARDYGQEAISRRIKELGLEGSVVFLGWLPFEDLPGLYAASTVFVFPTTHEGFGIPVLEAFASGVPVVCSRIEPLTEVAGDAALYIDPMSVSSIAEGILKALGDGGLRQRLVEKGFYRAGQFSWEKAVKETLSVFNSLKRG